MSAFTDLYRKDDPEAEKVALYAAFARSRPDDLHPELLGFDAPLGTFDDDPGGPWLAPGVPDDRPPCVTIRERPGWKPGVCSLPACGCSGLEHS